MITLFQALFAPPRHLILVLAALWIGLALAERRAERHHVSREALSNLVFYSLVGYILGGRLVYALANLPVFLQSPLSLFSLNLDLFDPLAGMAVALVIGGIYGSRQKFSFWSTLDALTPLFAAVSVGLSLSHLAAGTAFGRPTNLPWGIELWSAIRHPTQVYELAASLLIFGLIWFGRAGPPAGSVFLLFAALTAAARLFLEAFRGDSTLIFGGVRLAQVLAWIVLTAVLIASEWIRTRAAEEPA